MRVNATPKVEVRLVGEKRETWVIWDGRETLLAEEQSTEYSIAVTSPHFEHPRLTWWKRSKVKISLNSAVACQYPDWEK